MKVALIGCNGFVGSSIKKYLIKSKHIITLVNRSNYEKEKAKEKNFNVIINAAMPSKRFWAKKHPHLDYIETVKKTKNIINDWKFNKLIHISTVSARCQKNTIYGKNKYSSEMLCKKVKNYLIVRLGAMYGKKLDKGVLIDLIKNKKVFVSAKSKYSFTNVDWVGKWIVDNLDKKGLIEIGANDYYILSKLAKIIKSKSTFKGEIDNQIINNSENKSIKSSQVLKFLEKYK